MDWLWLFLTLLAVFDIVASKGRVLFAIGVYRLAEAALMWVFPETALQWTQTFVLLLGLLLWICELGDYRMVLAVEITMTVGMWALEKGSLGDLVVWELEEQSWLEVGKVLGIRALGLAVKYIIGLTGFATLSGLLSESLHFLEQATKQASTEAELGQMAANSLSNLLRTTCFLLLGQAFLWLLERVDGEAPWLLYKWQDGLIAYACAGLKAKEANSPAAFISTVVCGFLSIQTIRAVADWLLPGSYIG